MRSAIHAVIVDLDGTMVDTLGDFEEALNRTLADLDLPPVGRALIERTVGKGSEHLIRSVLSHQLALPEVTGLSNVCSARSVDTLYEPAWQRYQHHYHRINGQFSAVYPGVVDGLMALQRNLKALGTFGYHLKGDDSNWVGGQPQNAAAIAAWIDVQRADAQVRGQKR